MSRIGKNAIVLPVGVTMTVADQITVKGPLGSLSTPAHPAVTVTNDGANVSVAKNEGVENGSAMWGTMRANLNNMVMGVSKGFEKKAAVGWRGVSRPGSGRCPESVPWLLSPCRAQDASGCEG